MPASTAADRRVRQRRRDHGRRRCGRCPRQSVRWCSAICTRRGSSTRHRPRCTRPFSTRASTSPRSGPCTACWMLPVRFASAAINFAAPTTPDRSCWRATQRAVELGHHQAAGPAEVDLLLPLRHPRRVQPVHRGLDGRAPRVGRAGRAADQCDAGQAGDPPRQVDHPRRPRLVDDVQARRPAARRPRRPQTHSRPHVSNDNPYSESQFRTLKYRPSFPARFGSIQDARAFCRDFFPWYNGEHRHSGLGLCTPESVHYGRARHPRRACHRPDRRLHPHPERFVRHHPQPPPLPIAAWINPPLAKLAQEASPRQTRAAGPASLPREWFALTSITSVSSPPTSRRPCPPRRAACSLIDRRHLSHRG